MNIDFFLPTSFNDVGAIVFWVIIILLVIAAILLYLYYRKASKKVVKMQEDLSTKENTINQLKKSKDDTLKELTELKEKVDQIIQREKK
jgi:F0F1-type ATP synthase membrane subunit b/b'